MTDEIVSKEQCPECREEGRDSAEDNLTTFRSGVQYCVAGHGTLGVQKDGQSETKSIDKVAKINQAIEDGKLLIKKSSPDLVEGYFPTHPIRGISPKTFEYYGYQINKEKKLHIANYYNEAGQVVMQQTRDDKKQFYLLGDKSYNNTLYGSWLYTPDERVFITITEGQLDALSISESFDRKYPVVSLPNGASAAEKVIRANQKYLSGFKYVVLAFDGDGPGQEAVNNCLSLFEPGKLRIARFQRKDANEHLKVGEKKEIRDAVYGAVEYIPEPILTGQGLLDTLKDYKSNCKPWPWESVNRVISPIYIPGIYTIAGKPGRGKTVMMGEIMRHVVESGSKIGVISLEESVQKLILKLATALTGHDLRNIRNRALTEEEIELCRFTADNIVTFDHRTYGSKLETIIENLPYIAQSLNCEFVLFDNLSYSATNTEEDERRGIDQAMIKLKDNTTKHNYTLFNVTHLNEDNDDYKKCTIRGSRGISMYSDYIIYLDRDVESSDINIRNKLEFYIKKDRESGFDTGKCFSLKYNPCTRRLEDFY